MQTSDWFLTEILTGLQKLYLLHLANAPAPDEIEGCAHAWVEALCKARGWHQGERDRIRDSFTRLMGRQPHDGRPVFWPSPGDLLAECTDVPYHRPFDKVPALEWHKSKLTAETASLTAKAHCLFNVKRLRAMGFKDLQAPAWTAPTSDAQTEALKRMIADIRADEDREADRIRSQWAA